MTNFGDFFETDRSVIQAVAAALLVLAPGLATADADLFLMRNCVSCHAVDKKLVGPSYRDIAAHYAQEKDAEAKLVRAVREGSTGVFGNLAMPPNPQVSPDEARTLVRLILATHTAS